MPMVAGVVGQNNHKLKFTSILILILALSKQLIPFDFHSLITRNKSVGATYELR